MLPSATLRDLPAFRIGHAHNAEAGTGCTVIVAPNGATCGVDVRGGGPATRETDLIKPENMVEAVHAVVLSGGSAFGLEASCGVMDELAARGIGFQLGGAHVPIVVGASLFDLLVGTPAYPDKAMGKSAAQAAFAQPDDADAPAEGAVGAGCGATVGKMGAPERAMKSGLGWAAVRMGELTVAAIVAVNALGHVRDAQGTWLAGEVGDDGRVRDPLESMLSAAARQAAAAAANAPDGAAARESAASAALGGEGGDVGTAPDGAPCTNTTIGCVLTNASLTKAQAAKVSSTTHDAYARAIKPVHTSNDGDAIFTFASGPVPAPPDAVAALACEAMQAAIENAVRKADGAYGLKSWKDLQ